MAPRLILTGMGLASLGITVPMVANMPRMLIWNASASVPVGLYRIERHGVYSRGDLVVVAPTDDLARFMATRGYLPPSVPLIKAIAALPGQEVCRDGVTISIDGTVVAEALERDQQGRDLPRWRGCRRIAEGEFFLLNAGIRDSLDGRYFGPTPARDVIGKARPIYTTPTGESAFRGSSASHRLFRAMLLALALGIALPCTACAQVPQTGIASSGHPFAADITEASRRFGIPENWITAVMRIESAGKPRAISRKGAMGLMQIMPTTWDGLRIRHGLGPDPYDPRDNILVGTAYLRELHDRYGSPGFLAAYNAGPGRYEDYRAKGRPLPAETREYVARIMPFLGGSSLPGSIAIARVDAPAWRQARLFVTQVDDASNVAAAPTALHPTRDTSAPLVRDLSGIVPSARGLFVARAGSEAVR